MLPEPELVVCELSKYLTDSYANGTLYMISGHSLDTIKVSNGIPEWDSLDHKNMNAVNALSLARQDHAIGVVFERGLERIAADLGFDEKVEGNDYEGRFPKVDMYKLH